MESTVFDYKQIFKDKQFTIKYTDVCISLTLIRPNVNVQNFIMQIS